MAKFGIRWTWGPSPTLLLLDVFISVYAGISRLIVVFDGYLPVKQMYTTSK